MDEDGFGNGGVSQFSCEQPQGYVAVLGDCADDNDLISPNAVEVCDGADNNCDGLADDNDANLDLNTAIEWFEDADFDGFGNPFQPTFACIQPPGFIDNSDDCDDNNIYRNPEGVESCNNIDDNCDGTVDELAFDATDYYVDADGDGHGSLVDTGVGFDLRSCPVFDPVSNLPLNPAGYAPTNDDCDDGNPNISPSADELCSNDIDENCDLHNTAGATDVLTFLVDADEDGFGSGVRDAMMSFAYALDLCINLWLYSLYRGRQSGL